MQISALLALLPVLATVSVSAAPHLQHFPRSTPASKHPKDAVDVRVKAHPLQNFAKHHRRHSDEGAWYSDGTNGEWEMEGSPTEYHEADVGASPTEFREADAASTSPAPSSWSDMSSTPSETFMSTVGPTATSESASPTSMDMGVPTTTSSSMVSMSTTSMISSTTMMASMTESDMMSATSDAVVDAAAETEISTSTSSAPEPEQTAKGKKIRYKQCPSSGTVSGIKVTPCEGGKGTILDPCHFHAGSNYTIELSYVTPIDSKHPRSNLVARDRSMSNGPGSEDFPYSGQSFDACAYTECPIPANTTNMYTYEFVTLNDRFDQLTFNMTDGFEGPSMMCAYFPVTFVPNVVARSMRLPFAGLGARGPK